MSTKQGPTHIVVDGSNIATEGRSMPSLAQLSEAVGSFMEEYPNTAITVVVDATFGHRIDKKELKEFEAGIANNELVAPPAGAVGRGDAFVLGIANKAGSSVLSNDSFQEFHGEYTWLFDEGRLIGGKPVPHVGWVWVNRVPVRGPISRKATRGGSSGTRRGAGGRSRGGANRDEFEVRTGSPEASAPMPTPKSPPPGRTATRNAKTVAPPVVNESVAKAVPKAGDPVNELMPFLDFVEQHPVGSSVNGTVDAYSSHGAYITIVETGVRGYIPLRLMADPAPRSAKSVMKIDESVTVVVVSFAAARRSIDCALPDMAGAAVAESPLAPMDLRSPKPVGGPRVKGPATTPKSTAKKAFSKKAAVQKQAAKKPAASLAVDIAAVQQPGVIELPATTNSTPTKRSAARKTARAKSAAKQPVGKAAATQAPAMKRKPDTTKPPAPQVAAARAAKTAVKTAVKQTAVSKTVAPKTVAKQVAAKKALAKQTAAKKVAAKKIAAKQVAAKKTAAKQAAATKVVTPKTKKVAQTSLAKGQG
jgi:hypothetical protein